MNIRVLCYLLVLLLINCGIANAQNLSGQARSLELLPREREVELAVSAAPEHLRRAATVYVFGKQGYEKARSGTNGFTCLVNRDGAQSGDNTLRPTCWDLEGSNAIVPVMLRTAYIIVLASEPKSQMVH